MEQGIGGRQTVAEFAVLLQGPVRAGELQQGQEHKFAGLGRALA